MDTTTTMNPAGSDTDLDTSNYKSHDRSGLCIYPEFSIIEKEQASPPTGLEATTAHPTNTAHPANFMSLPAELRNEIYSQVLCYGTKQRLRLKLKTSADGRIYIVEKTPPICYAVPLLWREISSVYYGQNSFHVVIVTSKQRE